MICDHVNCAVSIYTLLDIATAREIRVTNYVVTTKVARIGLCSLETDCFVPTDGNRSVFSDSQCLLVLQVGVDTA